MDSNKASAFLGVALHVQWDFPDGIKAKASRSQLGRQLPDFMMFENVHAVHDGRIAMSCASSASIARDNSEFACPVFVLFVTLCLI